MENDIIPHGYWSCPDGNNYYMKKPPRWITKKFWSIFGIKYRLYLELPFERVDLLKIDLLKIDLSKIDLSKIDLSKIDNQ